MLRSFSQADFVYAGSAVRLWDLRNIIMHLKIDFVLRMSWLAADEQKHSLRHMAHTFTRRSWFLKAFELSVRILVLTPFNQYYITECFEVSVVVESNIPISGLHTYIIFVFYHAEKGQCKT